MLVIAWYHQRNISSKFDKITVREKCILKAHLDENKKMKFGQGTPLDTRSSIFSKFFIMSTEFNKNISD